MPASRRRASFFSLSLFSSRTLTGHVFLREAVEATEKRLWLPWQQEKAAAGREREKRKRKVCFFRCSAKSESEDLSLSTFEDETKTKTKNSSHQPLPQPLPSLATIPPFALQQGGLRVSFSPSVASSRSASVTKTNNNKTPMMNGRGSRGGAGGGVPAATTTTNAASASTAAPGSGAPAGGDSLAGRAPDENDWSTYFCTYAYLYHQVSLGVREERGMREKLV